MKAMVINQFGGPEQLAMQEVAKAHELIESERVRGKLVREVIG